MADIFTIESGVSPNTKYFDGRHWSVNRAEAYEFETYFDALQAQDYYRLEDGVVAKDISCRQVVGSC